MSDPKSLVGYCGLYCGTCGIYNGEIKESVEQLREMIKKYRFDEIMPELAEWEPALKHYKKFEGVLDGLVRLFGSCPSCRGGGGHQDCEIRKCAEHRGYTTCAECNDAFTCEKLKPVGKYVSKTLERIREVGVARWAEEIAHDRRKPPKTEICPIVGSRLKRRSARRL